MPTHPAARLHLPRPALGACVHLGVERDTRGISLTDAQRLNHYPATPLPTISWIFEGELHLVQTPGDERRPLNSPLTRVVFSGPCRKPTISWSPGAVHALTVAFYPQALRQLMGIEVDHYRNATLPLEAVLQGATQDSLMGIGAADGADPFADLESALLPLWQDAHGSHRLPTLRAWVQSMAVRASFSKAGAGLRQAQRRFKDWTGQSHREIQLYVRTELALARATAHADTTTPDIADVAADVGYADQSHLGREVRRVTGLSPKRLREFMRTDESFWFYRLLGEHLRSAASS